MALSDWTVYRDGGISFSDPQGLVFTDITAPMIGGGSVAMTHLPTTEFQSINLVPTTLPTGFNAGRMQTLIRIDDISGSSSEENHVGILCMQNVANMAQFGAFGGVGQSYGASLSIGEGGSPVNFRLWKFIAGLDGSTGSLNPSQILTSASPPFTINPGDTISLELEWRTEPQVVAQLGGALLTVRVGQLTNFGDLSDLFSFIDMTSPYIATVGESVWVGFKNQVPGSNRFTMDKTSLVRIILD